MDIDYYITCIGYATLIYIAVKCFTVAWVLFRAYFLTSFGFVKDLRKYGEWVIVTGATDGIGKQYAREFARQGFKLVLISRTQAKLESVAKEIVEEFNVEVKIVCFDFTQTVGYEKIEEVIGDLDIGILVNNVGMASDGVVYAYHDIDINHIENKLHCNIFSDVKMTHLVLKGMVARQRGAILHISSATIYANLPYIAVYPASKMFMEKFFKSLKLEYGGVVDHQLVTPAFVATNMSRKKPGMTSPTAEDYVKSAICTIGIMDSTCGYFIHEMQKIFLQLCPGWLVVSFMKPRQLRRLKRK